MIGDRILTPLRWNALADALCGHSQFRRPVDRNVLVRSLRDPEFVAFLGAEREDLIVRAAGMLRLNDASERPSPLVSAVYEAVKDEPLFHEAWNRRVVAGLLMDEKATTRNHPVVGKLAVYSIGMPIASHPDLFMVMLSPADRETAAKFGRLESEGTGSRAGSGAAIAAC